jgi:hypothetical protein
MADSKSYLLLRCWHCAQNIAFPTAEPLLTPVEARAAHVLMAPMWAHKCGVRQRGDLQYVGFLPAGPAPSAYHGPRHLQHYGPTL